MLMKKYFYLPSFALKRLKDENIKIYKNNFVEISDLKQIPFLNQDLQSELKTINLKYENYNVKKLVKKGDEHIEEVSELVYKLFNIKTKEDVENVEELTIRVMTESLYEVYNENLEEFIFNDISGFNPNYHSKKCDLILSKKIFKKYSTYIKNIILYEEGTFLSEIVAREDNVSKKELNEAIELYRIILGFSAKVKAEIGIYNNHFPQFRYNFERKHMRTTRSKKIIEKSKEVEKSIDEILIEFEKINSVLEERITQLENIRDKKHINFTKMKKNLFENWSFLPFIRKP